MLVQLSLTFKLTSSTAVVTWDAPIIGIRQSTFTMPYQGIDLELVARALDSLQSGSNIFKPQERQQLTILGLMDEFGRLHRDTHRRVGRVLYDALTADTEGAKTLNTVREYAIAQGYPLSLVMRFPPDAVELAALPWELLWDDQPIPFLLSGGQLASCVRYLNLPQALPPQIGHKPPLRLLAISPQAGIDDTIRQEERTARNNALEPLIKDGRLVVVEDVSPATLSAVVDAVQQHAPDIIHYYGHGRYSDGQGALLFDSPGGGMSWTTVDRLSALLIGVKFVILHACQGAMVSEAGLLTGIAPALSSAGIPLVFAMQQSFRITAATRASSIIYRMLAQGQNIQDAVNKARQALYIEEDDQVSWFVPTLYIRSRDTKPVYLVDLDEDNTPQPDEGTSGQQDSVISQRCIDLAELIREVLQMIKEFEQERMFANSPTDKRRIEKSLVDLRKQMEGYQQEFRNLGCTQ